MRRRAARRRAAPAARGAEALLTLADGRPIVMLSTALVYGDRDSAAVNDDAADSVPALAAAARCGRGRARGLARARIVRVPWVYGPGGLARDLIVGLRTRSFRIVGPGRNRWALLHADDAADALLAVRDLPAGVYSAAEADVPTQSEVVRAVCAVPGHPVPTTCRPALAAVSMGGAMSQALGMSLAIRTGRLADAGWSPGARLAPRPGQPGGGPSAAP